MNARNQGRVLGIILLICTFGLTVAQAQENPIDDPSLYVPCAGGMAICDLHTGLMWEKKTVGGDDESCVANLHAVNATCLFSETTTWIDALNAENTTGYAGFNDWRRPNVKELQSIVNYDGAPLFHEAFNPTAENDATWSSTSEFSDGEFAWTVDFSRGNVRSLEKEAESLHVRAVRGGRVRAVRGGRVRAAPAAPTAP